MAMNWKSSRTFHVVEHLLKQVQQSGVVFIRNGKEHLADEAASHMRKKYEHFKKKGEIKTPEDFIRLSATRSLISKKPYQVRLKDGRVQPTSTYMLNLLATYRKQPVTEGTPSS